MDPQPKSSFISIPGAIIVAGAIVAIALIYTMKPAGMAVKTTTDQSDEIRDVSLAPITATDHILGDPSAPVKIVEYSDPSCPYCKTFNQTIVRVMDQYGPSGKVAWIYRSFPLDKPGARPDGSALHPNAGHEAQAFECAASLGGNTGFWAFEKAFYETTPSVTSASPDGLDQSKIPDIARSVGLDPVAFNSCLSSGQFKDKVEAQYESGIRAGISGTPYSFILTPSGSKIPLAGATSYQTLKSAIDALLTDVRSVTATSTIQ